MQLKITHKGNFSKKKSVVEQFAFLLKFPTVNSYHVIDEQEPFKSCYRKTFFLDEKIYGSTEETIENLSKCIFHFPLPYIQT